MPGFNGMGPLNRGPMTGRGSGYCIAEVTPHNREFLSGIGLCFGMGLGSGRKLGRRIGCAPEGCVSGTSSFHERYKSLLKQRATYLKEELDRIETIIKDDSSSHPENKGAEA